MRPSRFRVAARAALAVVVTLALAPHIAHAEISESEKQAARNLYIEAVGLQGNQRYAEALDKLQRAQQVVPAPTNLLHIAECEVGLGKLLDASETYLAITKMSVGTNDAFIKAQAQAESELAALKPRIPTLRIDVTPKDAPNLSVTVDGQEVKTALLGVAMPFDPVAHTVVAVAPGFTSDTKSITLAERDQKSVALSLTSTGGVVYSSAEAVPPPPPPIDNGHPPPPPPVDNRPVAIPTKSERMFVLGASLGLLIPGGSLTGLSAQSLTSAASTGAAFGLEAGLRFSKFYIGVEYEHGAMGDGNPTTGTINTTSTSASNYFGISGVYISHPQGVGFYGELGAGYRALATNTRSEDPANSGSFSEIDTTYTGGELRLGAGVYIRASSWLRLIPKATVSLGSFSNASGSCSSSGDAFVNACQGQLTTSQSITSTSSHSFFFLGMSGDYEGAL